MKETGSHAAIQSLPRSAQQIYRGHMASDGSWRVVQALSTTANRFFFDCVCLVIVAAFHFEIYTRLTIDTLDLVIWVGIFALLRNYTSFPMTPTRTVIEVSKKCPKKLHPCGHFLYCEDGLPITTKEKLTLEAIGIITEANDPYSVKLDA